MVVKEFIQLRRDRVSFAMIVMIPVMQLLLFGYAINTTPRHLPTAVLLQEDSDLGALDPEGAGEHRLFPLHPAKCTTSRSSTISCSRARCCSAWKFRAASSARCGAANIRRFWSPPTRPIRSRPARRCRALGVVVQTALEHDLLRRRSAVAAVRDPHPCALQPGGIVTAQYRARAGRHHPDHDHADLHRAFGDARDRARHHGKPAVDADQAGRGDARQDRRPTCWSASSRPR